MHIICVGMCWFIYGVHCQASLSRAAFCSALATLLFPLQLLDQFQPEKVFLLSLLLSLSPCSFKGFGHSFYNGDKALLRKIHLKSWNKRVEKWVFHLQLDIFELCWAFHLQVELFEHTWSDPGSLSLAIVIVLNSWYLYWYGSRISLWTLALIWR